MGSVVSRVAALVRRIKYSDGFDVEIQTGSIPDSGSVIDFALSPDGHPDLLGRGDESQEARSIIGVSDRLVPVFYADLDVPDLLRSFIGYPVSLTFSWFQGIAENSADLHFQYLDVDTSQLLDYAEQSVAEIFQPTSGRYTGWYAHASLTVTGFVRQFVPTLRIKCGWLVAGSNNVGMWINIECAYTFSGSLTSAPAGSLRRQDSLSSFVLLHSESSDANEL